MRASTRRRQQARIVDVFKSDFIQDSGTPLQWLVAWEVVGDRERERTEAAAIKAMIIMKVLLEIGASFAAEYVAIASGDSDA